MNNHAYRKALSYTYKITRSSDRDLTHDAYVLWYEKTGKDLFDEPNRTIISIIRNLFWNKLQKRRYRVGGVIATKSYKYLDDPDEPFQLATKQTPENILLSKEKYQVLQQNLSDFDKITLELMLQGYLLKEIQEKQSRSNPIITASVKRIKTAINKLYQYE